MGWIFEELVREKLIAIREGRVQTVWRPAEWLERFCRQNGVVPAPYQMRAAEIMQKTKRLAVVGPHGLGKTALLAWLILSFVDTFDGWLDWKVVTTASSWTQLSQYLWPEIRKWGSKRQIKAKIGRAALLRLRGETGEAFAVASKHPEFVEGAHASALLFVFDEAKVVPDAMWDAAEGALTGDRCYAVAISTPGESRGRFYDIHRRKPGFTDWATMRVTSAEAIAAGRMSAEWAEARRKQWGENSAIYRRRVLGEFAEDEEHAVIPLDWVEAAQRRWLDQDGDWGPLDCVGVDIGYGEAMSTIAKRHGLAISEIEVLPHRDTMAVAQRVVELMKSASHGRTPYAVVDTVGYGAGVFDRLRQMGIRTWGFVAGARSRASTSADPVMAMRFANLRSEAWWLMRELLNPANGESVCLPDVEELTADLTTPKWIAREGRMIALEHKESLIKRLGRSTDWGDAVVQAFYPPPDWDLIEDGDDYEIAVV